MAKIGIVLATYNGEKYLPQMLDSLIAQSRQADEYRALAEKIEQNDMFVIPKPMTQERLEEILFEYGLMENVEADYRI